MKRRIGIIGQGAIGSELTAALLAAADPGFDVSVLRRRPVTPGETSGGATALPDLDALWRFEPELVVEAAGHGVVRDIIPQCIDRGISVLLASVGALADQSLLNELVSRARTGGAAIILPSGALGGLDSLRAHRYGRPVAVTYSSRKPPAAWTAELAQRGIDAEAMTAPVELLSGSARAAASAFPSNLNVAATLALAGTGMEATQVSVVADPNVDQNTHSVSITSAFGTTELVMRNRPSPQNAKTSWIVSRSLFSAIEQHFAVLKFL